MDPYQTAPIGKVFSGSTLFASILNSSVMLGYYLQQTTSADDILRCSFFLALRGLTPSGLFFNEPIAKLEKDTMYYITKKDKTSISNESNNKRHAIPSTCDILSYISHFNKNVVTFQILFI